MCTGISSIGQPSSTGSNRQADDGHVHRDHEDDGLAQVGKHAPPVAHRGDDRREIVVQQHQRGGFACDVGAPRAHRHADVGGLQRRRVVDAVAGHRHDLAAGPERLHQAQLLLGLDAAEDMRVGEPRAQRRHRSTPSAPPRDDRAVGGQPHLARDRQRRGRMVAGDHHDTDAGGTALGNGLRHIRAHRILQPDQAEELELEVMLVARQRG